MFPTSHAPRRGTRKRSASRHTSTSRTDIRVATVADPFGNLIGLIENPHFAESAVR
jgi:hypothetical protein